MKEKAQICPCQSGSSYEKCCKPYHSGKTQPATALQLMRSRYAAYALCIPEYIMGTTHPDNSEYSLDKTAWAKKIAQFCLNTKFQKLDILKFQQGSPWSIVIFTVSLFQEGKSIVFTEQSFFEKFMGQWRYRNGKCFTDPQEIVSVDLKNLLPLAYYGEKVLRRETDLIDSIDDGLKILAQKMIVTMDACDGLGLAAPQVHQSIRMFVIRQPVELADGRIELGEAKIFINPQISEESQQTWKAIEACISIPPVHKEVERPKEITIEYTDLNGRRIKEKVSGWQARVIMHEYDHVLGVLFIDYLSQQEKNAIAPFLHTLENRSD